MAIFLNAEKRLKLNLPLKVALLRYPMLKHYESSFGDKEEAKYVGVSVTKQATEAQELKLEKEIWLLEKHGLVPSRSNSSAPKDMAGAFLLARTQRWQKMFQRRHGPYTEDEPSLDDSTSQIKWPADEGSKVNWDCLERAKNSVNDVVHEGLPPIFAYHGNKDTACPIKDTGEFLALLKEHYPTRYSDDTAYLETVTELNSNKKPDDKQDDDEGIDHAFDYTILAEQEPWLKEMQDRIDKHWLIKVK
jgi:hypothetical protein